MKSNSNVNKRGRAGVTCPERTTTISEDLKGHCQNTTAQVANEIRLEKPDCHIGINEQDKRTHFVFILTKSPINSDHLLSQNFSLH